MKETWYKELLFNIQFYCWIKPKDFYYDVKWFVHNLWRFRKQLWKYRTWDAYHSVDLFTDSLEWLKKTIDEGHEEDRSRNKKVSAIAELISLLRHCYDDTEFDTCNPDTFEIIVPKGKFSEIREKNRNKTLNRIFRIIKGQTIKETNVDKKEFNGNEWYDAWVEKFDGTGIEGWWD